MGLAQLHNTLRLLPTPKAYWVAFSGGLDSHVLLHAMLQPAKDLGVPLKAVHVHHGLQEEADEWIEHCSAICSELAVPLTVCRLSTQPEAGESIEAFAREARYAAIADLFSEQEMLLTAQHQDDQAETLLLQLLRGAGADGLASMPLVKDWQSGWHARPLLAVSRETVQQYATQEHLSWIEDPSNQDQRFDRNYLRHSVMPVLKARWPASAQTLSRSAGNIAAVLPIIQQQAARDIEAVKSQAGRLQVDRLLSLPLERRNLAVREWIKQSKFSPPDNARLRELDQSIFNAAVDARPCVRWGNVIARRYRNELWLEPASDYVKPQDVIDWPDQVSIDLPPGCGQLQRQTAERGIPERYWHEGRISIRWRADGLRCRPQGRAGSRSFKKICHEMHIPPWRRAYVPLVFLDEQLIAIAGYCLCGEWEENAGDVFSQISWVQP